ncbi:MAG TPA: tetrathionate reductase subunit TtrA [Gammaproteobacteria bacterium]|nr:tetrathionate reductase subunit TtrA [Gammaproteobacteria bacterium]
MTDRRSFLKLFAATGVAGGVVGYSDVFYHMIPFNDRGERASHPVYGRSDAPEWLLNQATGEHRINPDFTLRHTVDLQCHSECGLRIKIDKKTGRIARIIGNPYQANCRSDYLDYNMPISKTATLPGTVCARGNTGLQTVYDPYRVTVPLKRSGPRGSNQWQPIEWEQFINEVVEGGRIFEDTNDPASKDIDVLGFRGLHAKRNQPMDPVATEMGRRSNGLVIQGGRVKATRRKFQTRFANAFGTVNEFEHTNVCEISHHIATDIVYPHKHVVKPDIRGAEFVMFWGTSPGDANFPMQTIAKYTAEARARGMRYVVVDPVLHRGGVIGDYAEWVPIKPGADGALAMGMVRWILDNARYNAGYLSYPNQKAAEAAGELSHTDAGFLVVVEPGHEEEGAWLSAAHAGLGEAGEDEHVVIAHSSGEAEAASHAGRAKFDYAGKVNGIAVKSAFRLLRESAESRSLEDYAKITGVSVEKIADLAREFTAHGRRACCEFYRGVVKHPNGFYNGFAIHMLNLLIGNLNWKGGISAGGGSYASMTGLYDLKTIPGGQKAQGIKINREGVNYEDSTEYKQKLAAGKDPYPARRPWFPHTFNVYSELLPSIMEGYPYKADILVWHMATPFYSVPGQHNEEMINKVKDPKNIPLIIASDIVVGDTSMYADYILPDTTFMERWVHIGLHEATMVKGTSVRWPVIEPLTGKTADGRHFSYETFLIDVAETLKLPGFGDKAIPDRDGKLWPLHNREDFYLKATANVAYANNQPVADVSDEDVEISDLASFRSQFEQSLPAAQWPKVLQVLARGGRFEPVSNVWDGDKLGHKYTRRLRLYAEEVALSRNSMTGKRFPGVPVWVEPATIHGKPLDELDPRAEWPLIILTYKGSLQTHSRLCSNTILREIQPENWIEVNRQTADKLGLKDGDYAWVETPHGRRKGHVKLREGVLPEVITFSVGYGHWGYGATALDIGGKRLQADKIRSAGIHLNPIMRRDPDVWQMTLMDPVGGSVSFYETRARLVPV